MYLNVPGHSGYDDAVQQTVRSSNKEAIAAEVWRRVFDFIIATHKQRDGVLERFGFTPGDSKAMLALDREEGRSMRSLADNWTCDASNATWMVDRLEKRGFAERRNLPGDRRVKTVVLTLKGARVKAQLMKALYEPPAMLLDLSREDLMALRDGLAKLPSRVPDE
jgi:DNA-binding MarR family transcriptional regulator